MTRSGIRWAPVILLAAIAGVWLTGTGSSAVINVPSDHPTISQALAAADEGATIRLAPGVYEEALLISRPVTLEGPRDGTAEIRGSRDGPVISVMDTSDVTIHRLNITGGEFGVLVRQSQDVAITGNTIRDNHMRGVRVVFGSAHITDNLIADTSGEGAKGVHIANALSWPESTVSNNVIERSGAEGILTNLAHVMIENNVVRDNQGRGISINEMSVASVVGNTVTGEGDTGILVLDMSSADVHNNDIEMAQGDGIRLEFHAEARLRNNSILSERGCGIISSVGSLASGDGNRLQGTTGSCGQPANLIR